MKLSQNCFEALFGAQRVLAAVFALTELTGSVGLSVAGARLMLWLYALGVYAIESIDYHPIVIEALIPNAPTEATLDEVIAAACASILDVQIANLSKDTAYQISRWEYLGLIPTIEHFAADKEAVSPDPTPGSSRIAAVIADFTNLRDQGEYGEIVRRFKIRSNRRS